MNNIVETIGWPFTDSEQHFSRKIELLPCDWLYCNARYCQGLSVRLTNVCIVTKRKKIVPTFFYHVKEHS